MKFLWRSISTTRRLLATHKDFYQVLGVSKDASAGEIKKKYYELAKQFHPDTNKDPAAKEKFVEIQNAYETLSDANKRKQYDMFGNAEQGQQFNQGFDQGFGGFNQGFNQGFGNFNQGFGGGFDIFGDLFRGGFRNSGQMMGEDVMLSMKIPFMEAVHGTKKEIAYVALSDCKPCKGSGVKENGKRHRCSRCNGSGYMVFTQGRSQMVSPCTQCGGKGTILPKESRCNTCDGVGKLKRRQTVEVTIPAGIDNGQRLRLSEKGDAPLEGSGRSGDLIIQIQVENHPQFKRDGSTILLDVSVPLHTALFGGTVTIPTIDGDVELTIPPGTQPSDRKTLRQRGVKQMNRQARGDQIVQIKVDIPTKLNAEQTKLLRQAFGLDSPDGEPKPAEDKSFFSKIFNKQH
ncbi:hypothetical protein EDD86DRAFT_201197 [Gorgonomyces haynaldii]|nr:hypothetical protein EDD86DRAFT_201197 [Gorgonomyces haynaldii]